MTSKIESIKVKGDIIYGEQNNIRKGINQSKKRDKSGSDARSSIEMHKLNTADPAN